MNKVQALVDCFCRSPAADGLGRSVCVGVLFRIPLARQFHWTISQVTLTFTIAIMVLGFASFFGGLWFEASRAACGRNDRRCAVWPAESFSASFFESRLWWLYLTYGVIGGLDWGLGISFRFCAGEVVSRPPRLMTGIAVGGFGAGALVTAPWRHD